MRECDADGHSKALGADASQAWLHCRVAVRKTCFPSSARCILFLPCKPHADLLSLQDMISGHREWLLCTVLVAGSSVQQACTVDSLS